MNLIRLHPARVDPVQSLYKFHTTVDVLRLDLLHPVISGNKWFKLKNYLADAIKLNKKYLLTFGGAYSNHIVASAAATRETGLKSIGIIRGEKPASFSHSLLSALENGMELFFTSREDYSCNRVPDDVFERYDRDDIYIVNEGGYGVKGMEGAMDIMDEAGRNSYTHIMAATGTGTMLAGIINSQPSQVQVTGISVLKNNFSVEDDIRSLLPPSKHPSVKIDYNYHFGGYAKKTSELLQFMNEWYENTGIPSDFVYTGKLFYAVKNLVSQGYFQDSDKILVIHSGGLQGNNSLPKGTLIF